MRFLNTFTCRKRWRLLIGILARESRRYANLKRSAQLVLRFEGKAQAGWAPAKGVAATLAVFLYECYKAEKPIAKL